MLILLFFFRGFNGLYHLLISLKDRPLPPNSRNTDSSDHGVVSRDNQYRIFNFCKCITKGKYSLGYNMRKTRGSIFLDALFQLIRFKYQHSDQRELSVQLTTFILHLISRYEITKKWLLSSWWKYYVVVMLNTKWSEKIESHEFYSYIEYLDVLSILLKVISLMALFICFIKFTDVAYMYLV